MCTTVGFRHKTGMVFGRTLELGVRLDHHILYVPREEEGFIRTREGQYASRYATIGMGFLHIPSFGDGINEKGLMGSNNFLPGYATFAKEPVIGKTNLLTSEAFDFLLTRCKDVDEVREEAGKLILLERSETGETSTSMHFFFMDRQGKKLVLEPDNGVLVAHDNPYGVLTNSPEFPWHATNLKNYLHVKPENIEEAVFGEATLSKLGEGNGMAGLPGDFTPPSRFVRAAYFVAHTPEDLERQAAIL